MSNSVLNILIVNLRSREAKVDQRHDLFKFVGGVSLATQLLKEYCGLQEDPLDENQPIIFTRGPLNTIFPVVTKVCAMFKSPLTGELGESYAGMRMALSMRMANIDGIVIIGKSDLPSYIHINGNMINIVDAQPLWGLDIDEATRLLHEKKGRNGLRSMAVIGPGGEHGVSFASVTVDTFRHFGRLGLGCLMGSKNLKAIVIEGNHNQPILEAKEYRSIYKEIFKEVTETDIMEKYHGIGTSINVNALNDMMALPSYNFQKSYFEHAENISGEKFAEERLVKKVACSGCPIGCIHIAALRKQFADPLEYEFKTISYDHELIYALGSMLGVSNHDGVLKLIETVERFGIDAMSTGVLLGWITEAFEKGIISKQDTLVEPSFGQVDDYINILGHLVKGANSFYKLARKGTYHVAKKYGGMDFAMVLGKTEVAGYHTGYANILGQAVGARHSHLDNAGYSIDQEMDSFDYDEIIEKLIEEEIDRNLLNSLVICLFARKVYSYPTVIKALQSIGYICKESDLKKLGRFTFVEKLKLKEKMGFKLDELVFPKRFFETPSLDEILVEDKLDRLLLKYVDKIKSIKSENNDLDSITLFNTCEQDKSMV